MATGVAGAEGSSPTATDGPVVQVWPESGAELFHQIGHLS